MLTVEEARARLLAAARPCEAETVPLGEAGARILAADVVARLDQPPFAASAMDGYAARFEEAAAPGAVLRVIGEAKAGERFEGALGPGEAVRIFTGGVVPAGADHILIQEDAAREGDRVRVTAAQAAPRHIRPLGADFRRGETVLAAGTPMTPPRLALAAAANHAQLSVFGRPGVAIIASGDELVAVGEEPGPGEIVSSTPFALEGWIPAWGGRPERRLHARDAKGSIHEALDAAEGCALLLPLGGASVGEYDLMKDVFRARGWRMLFEKAAVRPGKPVWAAEKEGGLALGLPGNPASALVIARLFLKPLLYAMTGRDAAEALRTLRARAAAPMRANGPREAYLRGRHEISDDGAITASADARQDSSLLTPFAEASCLIRRPPEAPAVAAGGALEILLFD